MSILVNLTGCPWHGWIWWSTRTYWRYRAKRTQGTSTCTAMSGSSPIFTPSLPSPFLSLLPFSLSGPHWCSRHGWHAWTDWISWRAWHKCESIHSLWSPSSPLFHPFPSSSLFHPFPLFPSLLGKFWPTWPGWWSWYPWKSWTRCMLNCFSKTGGVEIVFAWQASSLPLSLSLSLSPCFLL